MSIFFDFEVGPSGRRFRRAVDGDKDDIKLLLDSSQSKLFGDVDIGGLIERATLSISMINADKKVIGFMALCDHPNVPGVDPAHWEMWIRNLFQKFYLARNTLFIHVMCCVEEVEDIFVEEALISVFQNDHYLLHIVVMIPPDCPRETYLKYQTFRKRNLYKYCAQKQDDSDWSYCFYTALRKDFCPKLKIRRAVEEDNDDITAILDKKCPKLKDLYGHFYISEIIGRHPEINRKIIVADSQNVAVGVMCLNSDINYDTLQKTYELEPYHGLLKATGVEKEKNKRNNMLLKIFGEPIMLGKWSPFEQISKYEAPPIADDLSKEKLIDTKPPKSLSRVNFGRDAMRHSIDNFYIRQQSSEDYSDRSFFNFPPLQSKSDHNVVELLEEDPFDYEIVNIDTSLLTVPEVLSCDTLSFPKSLSPVQSGISHIQGSMKRRMSNYKRTLPQESLHKKYDGEPNAFMIELFGFREDIDERHGYDLLEAAFEIMNKYDYCIIRTPCNEKSFPLLQHFTFVPYKPNVCIKYALYVAHRNSVISKLRVRRAEIIDIPQIAQLMQSLDGKQTIWTVEDTILKRNKLEAYVFLSGLSLIGVGILEPPEHIDVVRAKFNMAPYHIHKYHYTGRGISAGFSTLKAVLAYPAFEPHYRFFIRDMMRQSNVNSLLWLTAYRNKWVIHKANSVAPSMVPLLPRKFELDYEQEDVKFLNDLSSTFTSFSAWFINKKITSIPKVNINTRIVIIGSSRTAISFINKLIFGDTSSYLMFTNVTLISKGGLPYVRRTKSVAETMFLKRQRGGEMFLKTVPYTYYVNVVQGTMVDINKKEKCVILANGSKCYYDMLFLLFGKQYQHPGYLKSPLQRERAIRLGTFQYTRLDMPSHHEEIVSNYDTPDNVFIVTCMADANKALQYVNTLLSQHRDYKIIVYGACIHAYCCLAALLQLKVPGKNIIFVEPFPPKNPAKTRVSLFCNDYVDNTINKTLDRLKIKVYRSFYFKSWITDFLNVATHVEFLSSFKLLRLECGAFFYYGKRSVDEQAFIAINKSGMAYDGGIVIDHEFRTLDSSIYAAGTATRYNRRYYAESKRQKYYDSREVGEKLGSQIRNQLDPLFTEKQITSRKQSVKFSHDSTSQPPNDKMSNTQRIEEHTNKNSECDNEDTYKLPDFKMPRVTHCTLPGDLQYLEVRPPAAKIPHHYVQSLQYNGFVMETFKTGYFKLRLTNELIVDGITCLTSKQYPLDNFVNLYGLSAVVLNNVHLRYTAKKLDDFYEFFRAPWAVFLYHDQTDELFAMVKELLPKGQHEGDTLKDGLRAVARKLSKTESVTTNTKLALRSNFEQSPHIAAITDYVMEWVSENDVVLPMYLQPSDKSYTHDVKRNPAFRKRKRRLTRLLTAIF